MDLLQSSSAPNNAAEFAEEFSGDSVANSLRAAVESSDDGALMLRYRSGDVRAFEILYTRHKGALYRYLQRLCRQRETVNDLFQEVWSRVIQTRERYEVRAQFTTFLFHIAHNCAMDHFRRAERQHANRTGDIVDLQDYLPGADVERPDLRASEAQLQAAFERALEKLPIEQRNAFVLREETGLSLEEIGHVTGVTMETAKSRLRYALVKLRDALKQYEPSRV
jgi:RNA polymerase sigma-70 factor (ECF subfamily)